ncbi:MAG: RNA polymerase factor sigma-54 [Candidatus Aminicenantes bacterium]|nr:RNA polymerase factor sigma-54 [Candidatus Aminicenantes bacterium]
MATKLVLKTQQKLLMNPVIHTFIGFLPLSRIEFLDKIKNEIDSNPMLELDAPEAEKTEPEATNVLEKKIERADQSLFNSYIEDGFLRNKDKLDKNSVIELFGTSRITLADHLIQQAQVQFTEKELELAKYIIYNLKDDGYLDFEVESVASSLNSTPEEMENIRNIIKTFDPRGVASKSLSECLLSQIEDIEENKTLIQLITFHLEDLSKSKFSNILSKLKIENEDLNMIIKRLKRLNPKPGYEFSQNEVDYADVDLILVKDPKKNDYQVKFVNDGVPNIVLSQYYDNMAGKAKDKETENYLKEKLKSASLFIEGTSLRKSMIEKIADYLVKAQKDFLEFGEKWKKPLTMKKVADDLGFNESTISRTVNNKFIATENGIVSLKKFFSHGIKGDFGFIHSVDTVRDKLKNIIEDEPREKPLSDQILAEKLKNLGIKISRRTVRNYRDEMNILNSSERKEEYKLKGD